MFDLGSVFVSIKVKQNELDGAIEKSKSKIDSFSQKMTKVGGSLAAIGTVSAGGLYLLNRTVDDSINSANKYQAALTGLDSVVRSLNGNQMAARKAAQDLAADGLMTVGDAATGLKNLLLAGFGLDQATQLMQRFKDSAAFARQGSLSFGDAITSATEGIKNGNSILVDNAGVTKNLSLMLEEAGFSAQDLMKASSDAGVRQAIFNGILKETTPQLGDAARLADSFAGAQSRMGAQTETLKQKLGAALQPALLKTMQVITPLLEKLGNWIEKNPELTAKIVLLAGALLGLMAILGAIGGFIILITPLIPIFAAIGGAIAAVVGAISLPVILIGALIAALIAAAWLLWKNWDTVTAFISDAWNTLKDNVVFIGQTIAQFFTDLWNGVVSTITSAWNWITSTIDNIRNAIVTGINDAFNAVVQWFIDLPQNALDWAYAMGKAVGQTVKFFLDLPGNVKAAFDQFVADAIKMATDVYNAVNKWIGDTANAVTKWFSELPSRISAWLENAKNAAINLATSIYNAINQWLNNTIQAVGNWFSQLPGRITAFLSNAKNAAVGLANGIKDGIMGVINDLPGLLSTAIDNAIKSVLNFANKAKDYAKRLADNFWQGFKDGLGIHSPSYIERAFMAMEDQANMTVGKMEGAIRQLNGIGSNVVDATVGSPIAGSNAVGGINIDMSGAVISSPDVAEQYAEMIGDKIITKLGNNVRL